MVKLRRFTLAYLKISLFIYSFVLRLFPIIFCCPEVFFISSSTSLSQSSADITLWVSEFLIQLIFHFTYKAFSFVVSVDILSFMLTYPCVCVFVNVCVLEISPIDTLILLDILSISTLNKFQRIILTGLLLIGSLV